MNAINNEENLFLYFFFSYFFFLIFFLVYGDVMGKGRSIPGEVHEERKIRGIWHPPFFVSLLSSSSSSPPKDLPPFDVDNHFPKKSQQKKTHTLHRLIPDLPPLFAPFLYFFVFCFFFVFAAFVAKTFGCDC